MLQLGLFTKKDINQLTGNPETAKTMINSYIKQGLITKISWNFYAVSSLETKTVIPNRFAIASNITEGSFVSHHSAFEYYGLYNQVFNNVFVGCRKKFKPIEFDGIRYVPIISKSDIGIEKQESSIRVTSLERTIVDSVRDCLKITGLEESLRCISLVVFIDEKKMLQYLFELNNQFLFQKIGYILWRFKTSMKLSESFFEVCHAKVHKSIRYLTTGNIDSGFIYDRFWQLYVPLDLNDVFKDVGDEDV